MSEPASWYHRASGPRPGRWGRMRLKRFKDWIKQHSNLCERNIKRSSRTWTSCLPADADSEAESDSKKNLPRQGWNPMQTTFAMTRIVSSHWQGLDNLKSFELQVCERNIKRSSRTWKNELLAGGRWLRLQKPQPLRWRCRHGWQYFEIRSEK